jgi:hypothetical protein
MCKFVAQTLTISNTSSVPLTWRATGDVSTVLLTPSGSTLPPNGQVSVSVIPQIAIGLFATSTVNIEADDAASQSISVFAQLGGKAPPQNLPPDIDFGNVSIGAQPTAFVPVVGPNVAIATIQSTTSSAFSLSGNAPNTQVGGFGWTVTFKPLTTGAQQATILFTDFNMDVCAPNSITAHGVGVSP